MSVDSNDQPECKDNRFFLSVQKNDEILFRSAVCLKWMGAGFGTHALLRRSVFAKMTVCESDLSDFSVKKRLAYLLLHLSSQTLIEKP